MCADRCSSHNFESNKRSCATLLPCPTTYLSSSDYARCLLALPGCHDNALNQSRLNKCMLLGLSPQLIQWLAVEFGSDLLCQTLDAQADSAASAGECRPSVPLLLPLTSAFLLCSCALLLFCRAISCDVQADNAAEGMRAARRRFSSVSATSDSPLEDLTDQLFLFVQHAICSPRQRRLCAMRCFHHPALLHERDEVQRLRLSRQPLKAGPAVRARAKECGRCCCSCGCGC